MITNDELMKLIKERCIVAMFYVDNTAEIFDITSTSINGGMIQINIEEDE